MIFRHNFWPKLLRISAVKYKNYSSNIVKRNSTMEKPDFPGRDLSSIVFELKKFAPLTLAESWDNVGLLIDPMESVKIKQILLTNDLTEDVVDEAIHMNAGLIISYHPNIFQPLKSVTSRTWKEIIVVKCIKHNIAVYSPHTSWDSINGGVNDWLSKAFEVQMSFPINPNSENPNVGLGRMCHLKSSVSVQQIINNIKSHIGIPHLRLALGKSKTEKDEVSLIGLCAGSGGSVLKGVKAHLYLTGEMLHHDILEATQNGVHVILCNHSDSERGFLKDFQVTLQKHILLNEVGVTVSQADRDPLVTV